MAPLASSWAFSFVDCVSSSWAPGLDSKVVLPSWDPISRPDPAWAWVEASEERTSGRSTSPTSFHTWGSRGPICCRLECNCGSAKASKSGSRSSCPEGVDVQDLSNGAQRVSAGSSKLSPKAETQSLSCAETTTDVPQHAGASEHACDRV